MPSALRRDADAPAVEQRHGDLEALAFLAQQVSGRELGVLEDELVWSREARMPILRSCLPTLRPGVSLGR